MLNTEYSYLQSGYKAGRARKLGDESLARHWTGWMREAMAAERSNEDKIEARRLFDQGYREGMGLS